MYQYRATITAVYDGDTCTAIVDLGLHVRVEATLRLHGINTPETASGEHSGLNACSRYCSRCKRFCMGDRAHGERKRSEGNLSVSH